MKTATELLNEAPASQVTRCRMAWNSIANGEWGDAAMYLSNASKEGAGPEYWHWASACAELGRFCQNKADAK